jgi:cation diffusion facilitator CzcD-associated flavoprotein CzcO
MTSDVLTGPPPGIGAPGAGGRHHRVAVIGAGFTGLTVGLALLRRGVEDVVLLERAHDVGGVWRDNTYPGVGVDTPSPLYQLRRMTNPDWSDMYAPGHEVLDYSRRLARTDGLMDRVRFGHGVHDARWDPAARCWRIATDRGQLTADVLVSAAGLVSDPKLPDVPGLDAFPGPSFHSSRWDHDVDLTGKRVAVVGTGASTVQIVPEIQPDVAELHLLQRTPAWVMPKPERPVPERTRRRLAANPFLMRMQFDVTYVGAEILAAARRVRTMRTGLMRIGRRHLEQQVTDPDLRERLTPDFEYLCKRPLVSNDYLPAVSAPNTTLHTGGLAEVRGDTVVAGDGTSAEVDVIVFATGFEIGATSPIARRIRDASGRSLSDHWGALPHAYLGMSYPGFPNFFLMQGPNATSGVSSTLLFAEAQGRYVADAVATMAADGIETVDVRPEVERRWTRRVRRRSARTVWEIGGCASYYQNDSGVNVVMWPGNTAEYQLRTRRFRRAAFRTVAGRRGAGRPLEVAAVP